MVKNPPANAGNASSIPGLGRSPGVGNGKALQYSCLENPMDRGAWWVIVHGVTKSWTQLSMHTHTDAVTAKGENKILLCIVFKNYFIIKQHPQNIPIKIFLHCKNRRQNKICVTISKRHYLVFIKCM